VTPIAGFVALPACGLALLTGVALRILVRRLRGTRPSAVGDDVERLRGLAAYLEAAREQERRRLARRLHDELAQPLAALGLRVRRLSGSVSPGHDAGGNHATALVESLIHTARSMIGELRPAVLDDFGLAAAVRWQVGEFRARTGIACGTDVEPGEVRCSRERAVAVFRTLEEALAGVAARAGVRRVRVALREVDGTIELTVADDGRDAPGAPGCGLASSWAVLRMHERVTLLGGDLDVASDDGAGVELRVRLPARSRPG